MRTIVLLSFFVFSLATLSAQDYQKSVGGKLGWGLIGSYKAFVNDDIAYEAFAGLRWSGLGAGVFVQKHKDIDQLDNLRWFWGGGASMTTWSYRYYDGFNNSYTEATAHFDIGLEYTFEDFPINVSIDWAPGIVAWTSYDRTFYRSYSRIRSGYGSLSVRYILGR